MTANRRDKGQGDVTKHFWGHRSSDEEDDVRGQTRRIHTPAEHEEGTNFIQATPCGWRFEAHRQIWRNGCARATGRNEKPSADWCRSTMGKPQHIHACA